MVDPTCPNTLEKEPVWTEVKNVIQGHTLVQYAGVSQFASKSTPNPPARDLSAFCSGLYYFLLLLLFTLHVENSNLNTGVS